MEGIPRQSPVFGRSPLFSCSRQNLIYPPPSPPSWTGIMKIFFLSSKLIRWKREIRESCIRKDVLCGNRVSEAEKDGNGCRKQRRLSMQSIFLSFVHLKWWSYELFYAKNNDDIYCSWLYLMEMCFTCANIET
jgi:hypothetical protein